MLDPTELSKIYPSSIISLFEAALKQGDVNSAPRFAMTRVLVELGKYNLQTVIPLLEQALQSKDKQLRWTTMQELVELGELYPEQVTSLIERTFDQNQSESTPANNQRIMVELGKRNLAKLTPIFEQALLSDNPDLQWVCILEIIELAASQPESVIPLLEQALKSDNTDLRWLATLELLEIAKTHSALVTPIFRQILEDESPSSEAEFNSITSSAHIDQQAISQALKNDDESIQWMAIVELEELAAAEPEQALPLFRKALQSSNSNLQWAIMIELIKLVKEHPQIVTPFLQEILNDEINLELNGPRTLVELSQENLPQALSLFEQAMLDSPNNQLQGTIILELFELLQIHVKKILPLLNNKLAVKSLSTLQQACTEDYIPQIVRTLEQAIINSDTDLQWTIIHKLIKLKLFTPEKIIAIIDKIIQRYVQTHSAQIESTRVLVELGQKYPELSVPIMQHAFEINNPELHWATILELLAIIKLCPQIAVDFQQFQLNAKAIS